MRFKCLYHADAVVADWVRERIPHVQGFGACSAIGILDGERLAAGFVFNEYHAPRDIMIHAAAESPWASRRIVGEILAYPFLQLGCARLTGATNSANRACMKMFEQVGFKPEGVLRRYYPAEDLHIYGLLVEEARPWLDHYWRKHAAKLE